MNPQYIYIGLLNIYGNIFRPQCKMYSDLDLDPTMPKTEFIEDIFISYSMF